MKIDIIIPVCLRVPSLVDLTYRAVESIKSEKHQLRLIIICTRLHAVELESFECSISSKFPFPYKIINEPGSDYSVAGAWNKGVKEITDPDYILIMANDVLLESDCIDRLVEFGEKSPDISVWSGIDTRDKIVKDPSLATDGTDFSCFMFRPSTIQKYGEFDQEFKPAYWEDNDYYARVILGGGECRVVHSARFFHYGSQTIKLDPEAAHHVNHWFGINKERFYQKWGVREPAKCKEEVLQKYNKVPFNK